MMTLLTSEAHEAMQTAVTRARQRLEVAQQELARVEEHVRHLRQFIHAGEALLGTPDPGDAAPAGTPRPTAAELAQAMLEDVGRPMTLGEMEAYLTQHGLLHGQAPLESLRAALRHRTTLFRRFKRGQYGLRRWGAPL
jgi:hypothetical protein